jgi:prephenate dehydrogenase
MAIGIVGLGLMGSSLGMAIRRARPEASLLGIDTDASVAQSALERGHVSQVASDLGLVRDLDLVVLAAPIPALRDILAGLTGVRGVVTDLASTKAEVMSWAEAVGVELVGGHPMCGRELSGIDAARADLFEGAPWVLTRPEPRVVEMVGLVGARPVVMDAARHDRLVAGISHAAFVLSAAYMLALSRSQDWEAMAELAAGGFRDMTRLASGDPAMYEAIALQNSENVDAWLGSIEKVIAELRGGLAGDGRLRRGFEDAKRARDEWAARRR